MIKIDYKEYLAMIAALWMIVKALWSRLKCLNNYQLEDTGPQIAPDAQLAPSWQPLPSVRALRWAGDSSREYPGLRP